MISNNIWSSSPLNTARMETFSFKRLLLVRLVLKPRQYVNYLEERKKT